MRSFFVRLFFLQLGLSSAFANIAPSTRQTVLTATLPKSLARETSSANVFAFLTLEQRLREKLRELFISDAKTQNGHHEPELPSKEAGERLRKLHSGGHVAPERSRANDSFIKRFLKNRNPTFSSQKLPSPSPVLKDDSNCIFIGAALGICNSLTPGFITLEPSAQAQCLCYSSMIWAPGVFDAAVNQCAMFASTAAPAAYEPLKVLGGFCQGIGDVKAPRSRSAVTTKTTAETDTTNVGDGSVTDEGDILGSRTAKISEISMFPPQASIANISGPRIPPPLEDFSSPVTFAPLPSSTLPPSSTTSPPTASIRSTFIHLTTTAVSTRTIISFPNPTSRAPRERRKVTKIEAIWVSFCCAMVLLFLC